MKKNLKIEKGLLDRLTDITSRSLSQTQFLFELCDFDFDKLLMLERKIKNNLLFYCPGDKDEVDLILKMGDGNKWFELTWFMCKPMCRPKNLEDILPVSPLTGYITNQLGENHCQSCGHTKFKSQWGIYWNQKELSDWIKNKGGLPNFWNDKDLFDVVIVSEKNANSKDETPLWG